MSDQLTTVDENDSKYRKRDSGNAGRCARSSSKKNYSHKRKHHGKKKECDVNNKTDLQGEDAITLTDKDAGGSI